MSEVKANTMKLKDIQEQLDSVAGEMFPILVSKAQRFEGFYGVTSIPERSIIRGVSEYRDRKGYSNVTVTYPADPNTEVPTSFRTTVNILKDDAEFQCIAGRAKQSIIRSFKKVAANNVMTSLAFSAETRVIGSDPEIFIENGQGGYIPAFAFLPDKKHKIKPNFINEERRNSTGVYWDGWQAEFESSATYCSNIHVDSIHTALKTIHQAAIAHNPAAKLTIKNTIELDQADLDEAKPEHVAFGCKPSLNVYGLPAPVLDGRSTKIRSAGGHLHFGIGKKSEALMSEIVKTLDAIIGVGCVSLFQNLDDPRRRLFYGLAGEYRLPPHGLEWRTLSNAWLCHPCIAHVVGDPARTAVRLALSGMSNLWKASEAEVIETIQNCDVKQAQRILKRNKELFLKLLECSYTEKERCELAFDTYINGVEYVVNDPNDFVNNWNLTSEWQAECALPNKKWNSVAAYVIANKGAKV